MTPLSAAPSSILATRRTFFARPSLVDDKIAPIDVLAVECRDGLLGFFGRAHGHEAKSAGTLTHLVHNEHSFSHGAELSEKFFQSSFRCLEGEIAYIEFHDVRYDV
jgi:hypothetical protein